MANPSELPRPRSPLWMVVLALACEEAMHPYRMQTLIKLRGKDQIANVAQRNSVYQTIAALLRAGLIAIGETSRAERRPERTTYEATDEGRRALRSWVRAGLSTPAREFPEFPAALATLYGYGVEGPEDFGVLLEARVTALERRLAELEKPAPGVPRIFLLEAEYMAAATRAEIRWLRAIVGDLRSGKLAFPTGEEIRRIGAELGAPSQKAVRRMTAEMRALQSAEAPRARTRRAQSPHRSAKVSPTGEDARRPPRVTTPSPHPREKAKRRR